MITYAGKLALSAALPVMAQAIATLDIPGLQGQVAGLVKVIANATVKPPSLSGTITFAGKLLAAAQVAIVPPAVSIVGSLEAKLVLLRARLELALVLKELLVQGSLRVYEYSGPAGQFGPELASTLAGPDDTGGVPAGAGTFAVVLLAEGGSAGELTLKTLRSGA